MTGHKTFLTAGNFDVGPINSKLLLMTIIQKRIKFIHLKICIKQRNFNLLIVFKMALRNFPVRNNPERNIPERNNPEHT